MKKRVWYLISPHSPAEIANSFPKAQITIWPQICNATACLSAQSISQKTPFPMPCPQLYQTMSNRAKADNASCCTSNEHLPPHADPGISLLQNIKFS